MKATVYRMRESTFNLLVQKTDGCWFWNGHHLPNGYAYSGGKYVHRISYEKRFGPIPCGMEIDHLCTNRGCVNPEHLQVVNRKENNRRSNSITARKLRQSKCVNGHSLDDPYIWIDKKGRTHRLCRECRTTAQKRRVR